MVIVDQLQLVFSRMVPTRSVERALRQVVPSASVKRAISACTHPGEVLEKLAEQQHYDVNAVLEEVAHCLSLPALHDLHIPSIELLRESGVEFEQLRREYVIPQRSLIAGGGLVFAVVDPSYLTTPYPGPLALTRYSLLAGTWKEFDSIAGIGAKQPFSFRHCQPVLRQLARDAMRLSAEEVFLGEPTKGEYQFISYGRRYRGKLNPLIYDCLVSSLTVDGQKVFAADGAFPWELRLTRSGGSQSARLFLAWQQLEEAK